MKKWRIWLRRTAWVAMGLVLMSGSVGISALASDMSETGTPQDRIVSEENGENTESDMTLIVKSFDSLDPEIQTQHLKAGEEPVLPDTLGVTVAIKSQAQEEKKAEGLGASNVVYTVGEISRLPEDQITLSGVQWELASTSESNNGTTHNYTPVAPTSYGEYDVEVLNAVAMAPSIQAMWAGSPAAQTNDMGRATATPSDLEDGKKYFIRENGLTVIGSEKADAGWSDTTKAGRIEIRQPGEYNISGELKWDVKDHVSSTDSFIEIQRPGDYTFVLDSLTIDIQKESYKSIFSIPKGAKVNILTRNEANLKAIEFDNFQHSIINDGEINISLQARVNCTGKIQNTGKINTDENSRFDVDGYFTNDGSVTISQSSAMATYSFTNNGTLEVNGKNPVGGDVSSLQVEGRLQNGKGRTVTLNEGSLTILEAKELKEGQTVKDWLIANEGTFAMKNGSTASTRDIENASGAVLTVNGENTTLTASGKVTTKGELAVDEGGKMNAAVLENGGTLTIGKGPLNSGTVTITSTAGGNINTGTIVVEANSFLNKDSNTSTVTLENNEPGSLTIKGDQCLGSGPTELSLTGSGTFIFAGLTDKILHLPDAYTLNYTGESQTENVAGLSPHIVDSTAVIEDPENPDNPPKPVNKNGGVVTIDQELKSFHGVDFTVKVKAQLKTIMLTRAKRDADTSDGWKPGVEGVDSTDPTITTIDVTNGKRILEPGHYELIYENTEVPDQTASVEFDMTEWSIVLDTSRGADDVVKEMDPDNASDYAVYENKNDINCTVRVAIFNEKDARVGKVTLYWDAYDRVTTTKKKPSSKSVDIPIDEYGRGTANITIPLAKGTEDYILPPPLKDDPSTWETEDEAYGHPYRLTAVYESQGGDWYHTGTLAGKDDPHYELLTDKTGTLAGWYADKKLIIIRQKPNLQFTSNYYTNTDGLLTYNGEPLRMPEVAKDDIRCESDKDSLEYEWYKGLETQVMTAYETQTVNVSGLQPWVPRDDEKDEEGNLATAPRDAGWYIIKARVPANRDYIGETRLHYIHVEPKNLTVSVKNQHKPYGAKDPDEWSGFLISNDVNEAASDLYVVEGLLDIDNGKMKGEITRVDDDKGEECGRYEIKITAWAEDGDPTRDNYKIDTRKGIGTLTIDQRELEWDAEKLFLVITDDDTVSVVGGLKTDYHLVDGENKADVEDALKDDDVVAVYDKLDLSSDKGKITIDKLRLGGADKDNYVIQSKSFSVPANSVYKISVKTGTIDSTTMTKLKDHGTQYSTEDQVIKALESQLESQGAKRNNTAVYDIILTKANGDPLSEAEIEEFPWGALTVTVPFPAGTSRATSFAAAHMITEKTNLDGPNKSPGNLETRTWNQVATVEDGVRFQLESLSPIAIGWATTTNNPNNPNDPNGGNNGSNNGNNGANGGTNGSGNGNQGNNSGNNNNNNNSNNKATNSNTTKATNSNATRTTGVKTGDPAQIAFYSIATLIACLLLILIIFLIRAQFRRKD